MPDYSSIPRTPIYLALIASLAAPANAQVPVDAGSLLQQIERDRTPALPASARPLPAAPPAPLKLADGVTVTVNAFRFTGNTLVKDEALAEPLTSYLGRPLGFAELQQATQAVASIYRQAGWIVNTYLPTQDVSDGIITIQIIEAVYGGTRLDGTPPARLKLDYLLARFDAQQKVGEPINVEALDRALLLADDLPGVAVSGALSPGERTDETLLALKLTDEPLVLGDIGVDNHGARSTGEDRVTLNSSLLSPFGIGDQLVANLIHSEGSDYGRLEYSVPVGNDGARVGVNASRFDYELIPTEFKLLNGSGESETVGFDASYPLIRSRRRNVYVTLNWDHKRFHNQALTLVQSDYAVKNWSLGIAGNAFDTWGGGGANAFALSWVTGNVDQGRDDIAENTDLDGNFDKWRYAFSRQQMLTQDLSLYALLSGQHAQTDLDSSERFYLGGANGVRAYPSSEGGGSRGMLATVELRKRLPQNIVLACFYDWGHITNFDVGSSYALKGYGLSVGWTGPMGLNLKAVLARRDGDNPNPTATGDDQDGSLDRNRLRLSASVPF
jgi:hemolysin activation/secretion protein